MAGHGYGPNSLETKIRTAMQELGIYAEAWEMDIRRLAQLERELRRAEKAWRAAGSPLTVTHTNKAGATNEVPAPSYTAIQQLRRDIQAQRKALGLIPGGKRPAAAVDDEDEEPELTPAAAAVRDYAAALDAMWAEVSASATTATHEAALAYAAPRASGEIPECEGVALACSRFLRDLEEDKWDHRTALPEWVARVVCGLQHVKGERPDGTPLRGLPMDLLPWQLFILDNLCGFFEPGTEIRRYLEDFIFLSRKNSKTTFAAALSWALGWYYRRSNAVIYIIGGTSRQAQQAFDFLAAQARRLGMVGKGGAELLDNYMQHRLRIVLPDGEITIAALAYKEGSLDSLNCNIVIADEMHVYKSASPYTLMRQATKAYTNKLVSGISSAGDDGQGFCAQRLQYALRVLRGLVDTADADRFFAFAAYAPRPADGSEVDFTNPEVLRMANPSYGEIIRPADILSEAMSAQNDPQLRKNFFTRSLNLFVSSVRAYFDVDVFRRSDLQYAWTLDELAKLPVQWYGGADLARQHDLTAAALVADYQGKLIIIPHCWFPVTAAALKADQDQIPLFGWQEDGWLDMSNDAVTNHMEVVAWFKDMRARGFKIRQIGHDRKFCPEYQSGMKAAGFRVVDQPQLNYLLTQGFRMIEKRSLLGDLYYLHAEPFEYCLGNLYVIDKDDVVIYSKLNPNLRIDIFDAAVFACVRLLSDAGKLEDARKWLGGEGRST